MNDGFLIAQIVNIVIVPLFLALPIVAIIKMFRQKLSGSEAILWILLILFFPLIGSLIFLAWRPNKRKRKNSELV